MKIMVLIPARKGSKRLKNKNNINFNGKPLIQYSIEFAKCFFKNEDIYVSSDCSKILKLSKKLKINFINRPYILAGDKVSSESVCFHALNLFKPYDSLLLLQPTSPLRLHKTFKKILNYINKNKVTSLVSFKSLDNNQSWLYSISQNNNLKSLSSYKKKLICMPNGAYFYATRKNLFKYKKFINKETKGYLISNIESIDIDTNEDLIEAKKYHMQYNSLFKI